MLIASFSLHPHTHNPTYIYYYVIYSKCSYSVTFTPFLSISFTYAAKNTKNLQNCQSLLKLCRYYCKKSSIFAVASCTTLHSAYMNKHN